MKRYNTIFVDCFDTIIHRNVHPDSIVELWAMKIAYLFDYKIVPEEIVQLRQVTFSDLAMKYGDIQCVDYNEFCSEFLRRLKVIYNVDLDIEEFYKNSLNIEVDIEKKNQFLNKKMIENLKKFKAEGCRIYLVSDFYFNKTVIKEFLKSFEIIGLFDDVFVSCDVKKSKSKSTIYPFILAKLELKAEDCIMMGDNITSDCENAKKYGINFKLYKNRRIKNFYKNFNRKQVNFDILNSEFRKIFNSGSGVSNYVFSLYIFTVKLYKNLVEKNVKNIFFLSREGQFLKKIFDKYCETKEIKIKSHYLQVSRNSTFLACLKEIDEESFKTIFNIFKDMSVKDFLISLSFTDEDIKKITVDCDIERKIQNFRESSEFNKLKNNSQFIELYEKNRKKQKQNFRRYLESFGVDFIKEGLNIVDVGWVGTMQENLNLAMENCIGISGFYLGLTSGQYVTEKSKKTGILFSYFPRKISDYQHYWEQNRENYEVILKADHSRVNRYLVKDDKITIEYDDNDGVEVYERFIKSIQEEIYDKFIRINKILSKYTSNDFPYEKQFLLFHLSMFVKNSFNDYMILKRSLKFHKEGFGDVYNHGFSNLQFLRYLKNKLRNFIRIRKFKRKFCQY